MHRMEKGKVRNEGCVYVCVCVCESLSRVQPFATPWAVAHQAPLSMGFSRQGYWSGLPFPPPGDLPEPEIEPQSLASPALAGGIFTAAPPGKTKDSTGNYKNIQSHQ